MQHLVDVGAPLSIIACRLHGSMPYRSNGVHLLAPAWPDCGAVSLEKEICEGTAASGGATLCAQVLLPAGPDAQQLPEWIFERSPGELKAAAVAARRRQDLEQVKHHLPSTYSSTYYE